MNCRKRILSIVLILVTLVSIMAMTAGASDDVKSAVGIVKASALRLREKATTSSSTIATAYRDDYVVVLESEGSWYKVIYNLRVGYMHEDYLTVKEKENVELGYGEINASRVNMRGKPNTSSSVVSQLTAGQKAYIIGFNCGWYKVKYDDQTGYIRSDLLDLTEIPYENTGSTNSPKYFKNGDPIGSGSSTSGGSGSTGSSSSNSAGQAIVAKAKQYLGVPYVWGGSSPSGFDCSGFTQYVMRACGYTISRTASQQLKNGTSVSYANLKLGDLVFFENTYNTNAAASHVGIYVGDGNFIHAGTNGVVITSLSSDYYASRYVGARRIV